MAAMALHFWDITFVKARMFRSRDPFSQNAKKSATINLKQAHYSVWYFEFGAIACQAVESILQYAKDVRYLMSQGL